MKRTVIFAALALATLLAMSSPAQARYRDGMNLYEYVQSRPTRSLDPQGTAVCIEDSLGGIGGGSCGGGHPGYGSETLIVALENAPQPDGLEQPKGPVLDLFPNTSTGPVGMAMAYFGWGGLRTTDEVTYDESTDLVKAVKKSQTYACFKTLYMESPAEQAALEWSKLVGDKKVCEQVPGMAVRNGGWMPTIAEPCPALGFGQNYAWWWQYHRVGFDGDYYLGGMLGRSYIDARMSCEFCQKCVKGKWEITGDCTARLHISDKWDLGGNEDDNCVEDMVGALGKPIKMYLDWSDSFKVKRSRKPGQ